MLRIGVTGGIGSGKTTVCRIFAGLGVPVFDSDCRAKALMNGNRELIACIKALLGERAYSGGRLDTAYVASIVFKDKELLTSLNGIVHPAVMDDFDRWAAEMEGKGAQYVIQENAILFEGGFERFMDYSVCVSAPPELRIARAAARSGADPAQVRERIANQMNDREREAMADYMIRNGGNDMLLPQVLKLHGIFCETASHDRK